MDLDVNKVVRKGFSPLYLAAFYGYADIVQLLIDNGADFDAALRQANRDEINSVISFLLSYKEVNKQLK